MRQGLTLLFLVGVLFSLPFKAGALSVAPPKFTFQADPGEALQGRIALINNTENVITLYPSFSRVESKGSYGEPIFTGDVKGLASWIEVSEQEVVLEPNTQQAVVFWVQVPEDAPPGGHYAAIFWGTQAKSAAGGVGVASRIAVLVLLNVSGDIEEGGGLSDFRAEQKLFNSLPVVFNYKFGNDGTVFLSPGGELVIKDIFGRVKASLPANPQQFNVLPGSRRDFTLVWRKPEAPQKDYGKGFFSQLKKEKEHFALGWFRAYLNVSYGQEGSTAQAKLSFWIIPWRILSVTISGFLVLLGLLILLIRRYNRWILKKAQANRGRGRRPSKKR